MFNSLKLGPDPYDLVDLIEAFQFLIGKIKTDKKEQRFTFVKQFQFLIGKIQTYSMK
ncbi:hypothetical protein PspKH34_23060 [Parageobacillus sp. KH3-4]|nr:hypothetical protein PspKH34_23060 [Parageobacillus sp. KH3-4]